MIIEIIVLLGFLGSIVGFIFFIKHYFKTSKVKSHNKKMLLAIESAKDKYTSSDKFYHNALVDFLSDVNWGKVVMFTFVIGIAVIIFFTFAAPNTDTFNGNQGVQPSIQTNESNNMSIDGFFPSFLKSSDGRVPFWIFFVIGGIMMWIILRQVRRHSFY